MWTTSNGCSRAIAGVATAGVVALTAGVVTAVPAAVPAAALPSAPVFAPVELTALTGDSSLMDIIGALTGLGWLIPFLDDPENPVFPIVIGLEALGELFVVIPLTLLVGTPLLLITEGWQGIEDTITLLGTATDAVSHLFDNMAEWYETHNWLTGALLDAGSSESVDLSSWDGFVNSRSFDDVFTADGFDAVLADFGLGDLIA